MNVFSDRLRLAERTAYCRSCDLEIPKGTQMVSFYSHRNRGMSVHLCTSCVQQLAALVKDGGSNDA